MRLGEVKDLPKPREIKGKASIDGKKGGIYNLNTKDGKNVVLRNFSTSVDQTKARWTIQIDQKKLKTVELKFQ